MCPISMPRAASSTPVPSGDGSPARTSAASIVPSGVKSRPDDEVDDVVVGLVRARHPGRARDDPGIDEETHAVRGQRAGADVALHQERVRGEVGLLQQRDLGGRDRRLQALHVDLAVAGHADGQQLPAVHAGQAGLDQHVLQRVGGRERAAEARTVQEGDQRLDRRRVRCVVHLRGGLVVDGLRGGRGRGRPPRRSRRSRPARGRRCPPPSRTRRGTPRWPSRPSPPTSPRR